MSAPAKRTGGPAAGLVWTLCLGVSLAAAAAQAPLADRAAAAWQDRDWSQAARLYGEMESDPEVRGMALFRRGVALLYLGDVPAARLLLNAAEAAGWTPAAVAYRRACADALEGKTASAVAELERAVAGGFSQTALLDSEPLLASLRSDPGFARAKQSIERAAHPCRQDSRYRAFDFWLGTWEVRPAGAPDSTPPSENVVTAEHDGCVLVEHWSGLGGTTGSSFNIFDQSRNRWFQTWVDSGGGLHEYNGNPDAAGNMVFLGETPGSPGQPARVPTRLSFFRLSDDRVRQLSERALDGQTWITQYDLIYVRRRP
jgi:hypothetical protein